MAGSKSKQSDVKPTASRDLDAPAAASWIFQIEEIAMTATRRDTRILGLVGVEANTGVTQISELMATSFARSQRRTLFLDLRAQISYTEEDAEGWAPGASDVARFVEIDARGFHRLRPNPTASTRPLFNNVELMRNTLENDLKGYEQIIVDLPNLTDSGVDGVNPIGPAVACDAVLLVCMTGRTARPQAMRALERLQTAGANVAGTILNDEENVTLGGDIAKFARRIRWLSPSFARRLERFGRTNATLN